MRILLILILISILSTVFFQNHWFDINPDGVSYLQIAHLYHNGEFLNALNGYWSPFFSWLIALISFLIDPFVAAKILVFISILLFVVLSYFVSKKISKNESIAQITTFLVATFPQLHEWLLLITPDVLFSCIVLVIFFFWYQLLNKRSFFGEWFFLGLLSGIGFLAKSFFLSFAFIFIPIFTLGKTGFRNWRKITVFLIALLIIPLVWSGLLYSKYHRFTFGTSAALTYERFVLGKDYVFLHQPMRYPTTQSSFWTDPTAFPKLEFNGYSQAIVFKENIVRVFMFLFRSFPFFFVALFFWIRGKKSQTDTFLLSISIFWILSYSLVLIEGRYLIPIIPFLILFTVQTIVQHKKHLLFPLLIVQLLLFSFNFVRHFPSNSVGITHYKTATKLPKNCVLISDDWSRGLAVSYFSQCSYLGVVGKNSKTLDATHFISFRSGVVQLFSLK